MVTYQEYLRNKDGEIFSPITSSDTVYLPESLGGGNSTEFLKQINEFRGNYNKTHLGVSTDSKNGSLVKLHVGSYSRFLIQVVGTINFAESLPIFTMLKFNIDQTGTQLLNFTPINLPGFSSTPQFSATISGNIVSLTISNLGEWAGLYLQILRNDSTVYFVGSEAV